MEEQIKTIEETYQKTFPTEPESAIQVNVLKAIPWNGAHGIKTSSTISTEEYVSRCPWSGFPDFAVLDLSYEPHRAILEMKSFKVYLTSFANVGITMERACQRICFDLGELLFPRRLEVTMQFKPRGGHSNLVICEWTRPR